MSRRFNFKILIKGLIATLVLLFVSQPVMAVRGPAGVSYGLHNLSATGADPSDVFTTNSGPPLFTPITIVGGAGSSPYITDEDQICVFCHTPHGGSLTGPLWNRTNPNSTWSHYNSASMSSYLQGLSVSRTVENESLLCMSCHDGSISVNHVLNLPNDRNGALINTQVALGGDPLDDTKIISLGGTGGARIGESTSLASGDLSDDHPISFSYAGVLASSEYTVGSKVGELHSVTDAVTAGVQFFDGGVTGDDRVECSSCHDPHVNYNTGQGGDADYAPFLIMPNNGSALCLACHNK